MGRVAAAAPAPPARSTDANLRRGGKAPVPRKTSDGSNSSASEAEQDEDLAFPMDDDPKVQKRVAEKKAEKGTAFVQCRL